MIHSVKSPNVIRVILENLMIRGYSAENVAFGMGGGLLQKVDRDSFGFAMKCSFATVNGVEIDVFKEAPGKFSKKGRLELVRRDGNILTVRREEVLESDTLMMIDMFDTDSFWTESVDEVRKTTGTW
jgi:nicotinamide phosphoribosyltransferase